MRSAAFHCRLLALLVEVQQLVAAVLVLPAEGGVEVLLDGPLDPVRRPCIAFLRRHVRPSLAPSRDAASIRSAYLYYALCGRVKARSWHADDTRPAPSGRSRAGISVARIVAGARAGWSSPGERRARCLRPAGSIRRRFVERGVLDQRPSCRRGQAGRPRRIGWSSIFWAVRPARAATWTRSESGGGAR